MDKFTRQMLAETGLLGMVGKAERGPEAVDAIREFGAVYLMAVGGAAYLVSKAIRSSRLMAFDDLGMEAIYEFEVRDMPVTVAVDAKGTSVHVTGPAEWRQRIARHSDSAIQPGARDPGTLVRRDCQRRVLRRPRRPPGRSRRGRLPWPDRLLPHPWRSRRRRRWRERPTSPELAEVRNRRALRLCNFVQQQTKES